MPGYPQPPVHPQAHVHPDILHRQPKGEEEPCAVATPALPAGPGGGPHACPRPGRLRLLADAVLRCPCGRWPPAPGGSAGPQPSPCGGNWGEGGGWGGGGLKIPPHTPPRKAALARCMRGDHARPPPSCGDTHGAFIHGECPSSSLLGWRATRESPGEKHGWEPELHPPAPPAPSLVSDDVEVVLAGALRVGVDGLVPEGGLAPQEIIVIHRDLGAGGHRGVAPTTPCPGGGVGQGGLSP